MSRDISVSSCPAVKAVCHGKPVCLDICPLPPPGRNSLTAFVGDPKCVYVQLFRLFRIERISKYRDSAIKLHFSVDRHRKCIKLPKKTRSQGNTVHSRKNGDSRIRGVFLSAPGFRLSRLYVKTFALTRSVNG